MDAYSVLGVARSATDADIRRAYRARARKQHPDRPGGSHEQFLLLQAAYAILIDPEQRRAHDAAPEETYAARLDAERRRGQLERRRSRLRRLYDRG